MTNYIVQTVDFEYVVTGTETLIKAKAKVGDFSQVEHIFIKDTDEEIEVEDFPAY